MHTNGGDRWVIIDVLYGTEVDSYRSQMKCREAFIKITNEDRSKPYEMLRWDEYTNTRVKATPSTVIASNTK